MQGIGAVLVLSCGMATAIVGIQQPKPEARRSTPMLWCCRTSSSASTSTWSSTSGSRRRAPPLKKVDDPAKIQASQKALATAIRSERAGAKQGDIFTPEIAERLRRLIYPEVTGTKGVKTKEVIKEDAPPAVVLKVNAPYTADALPTVPPNILANLPQLPEDLEYRIVGRDLILRDVHANLIVDFIPRIMR